MKRSTLSLILLAFALSWSSARAQTSAVRLSGGKVVNCIVVQNERLMPVNEGVTVEFSLSDSALTGIGNVFSPQTSPFGADFRINKGSPAYDKGRKSDLRASDTLDLDFNPRVSCENLDIGAFEYEIRMTEITANPQPQRVCEGERPVLFVEANGTNLQYQWQRNGVNISGATGKSYMLSGRVQDAGSYRVIAFGDCCNDTSAEVAVEIDALPNFAACADTTISYRSSYTLCATPNATYWQVLGTATKLTSLNIAPTETTGFLAVLETPNCGRIFDTLWVFVQAPDTFDINLLSGMGCEENTGWATAVIDGTTAPYTFLWSNGANTATITDLPEGETYTVTITDSLGITLSETVVIPDVSLPEIFSSQVDPDNAECDGGTIFISINGGNPPYSYVWDDGYVSDQSGSRFSLKAGNYALTVTDADGCEQSTEISLICRFERVLPTLYISPNGDGKNDRLEIRHIEDYPLNTVIIVNAKGAEIVRFRNYNNRDVAWDGRNELGKVQPDGLYYYIVEVEGVKSMIGWLMMEAAKSR